MVTSPHASTKLCAGSGARGLHGLTLPPRGLPAGVQPLLVAAGALDGLFNEVDAPRSVVDGREVVLQAVGAGLPSPDPDRRGDAGVDVGERLDERLGVAGGYPRGLPGVLAKVGVAALEDLFGSLVRLEAQVVRLLLSPLEAALGSVDADAQVVLLAGGDLGSDQHALRAAFVADQEVPVVVETPARHEGGELRPDLGDFAAGDRG